MRVSLGCWISFPPSIPSLLDVREVTGADAPAKTEALVELRRGGIVGAQVQAREPASRRRHDFRHQLPAHPQPPICRPDVQVPYPANVRLGGIRSDVEP